MNMEFIKVLPEEVGADAALINEQLDKLEKYRVPMHSFLMARGDKLFLSSYYYPYDEKTAHRLYSCTKSLTSLAIGALADRGALKLSDHIVSYFPQYSPVHPYLEELTIENMLKMSTCYSKTTYKAGGDSSYIPSYQRDWVGSFFKSAPEHKSGTFFFYDTSSTHTLCVLVEKLTGKSLLEFLREVFMDEIGCSRDMSAVEDPMGHTSGGSGVLMRPLDLLKIMRMVADKGDGLISKEYIAKATSKQIENVTTAGAYGLDNHLGYGYQFWIMRDSSPAMYGLGGQFAIYIPSKDIVAVTTADTQGTQGYDNLILDSIFTIAENVKDEVLKPSGNVREARTLVSLKTNETPSLSNESFKLKTNKEGITAFSLETKEKEGALAFEKAGKTYVIPFGYGENVFTPSPFENGGTIAASASFFSQSVSIAVKLLSFELGSLNIEVVKKDGRAFLFMKLIGELNITGLSGLFESI